MPYSGKPAPGPDPAPFLQRRRTGSVKSPPPPPPDIREWKTSTRKIERVQVFGADGELLFENHWQASGRYRLRAGWFGLAVLEEEQVLFGNGVKISTRTRWRRAIRGKVTPSFGIDIGDHNG